MSDETRQIVILGTGRCGTVSMTKLIDRQEGWIARHEAEPLLPWEPDLTLLKSKLRYWRRVDKYAEAGFYFLPYVEAINGRLEDVKFICLKRNKHDTVESYLKKLDERPGEPPRNHWVDHDLIERYRPDPRWDDKFPTYYGELDYAGEWERSDYIYKYWVKYYNKARELRDDLNNFYLMSMSEALNTEAGQRRLFERLEIDDPALDVGIKKNEGG